MPNAREIYKTDYLDEFHKPVPIVEGSALEVFNQDSPLYFPTYERPVCFVGKGEMSYTIEDKKAIVRLLNGKPHCLGIVGIKYKVITMKDVCEASEKTFIDVLNDNELAHVQRRDRIAYYGGQCIRDYIFPNIQTKVGVNSDVSFRTVIVNGYDGSSSFKLYSGAIDFFCENRLVTGSFNMTIHRHTSGFAIPHMRDRIRRSIDVFFKQADLWSEWTGREITDDAAKTCYEAIPGISERRVLQLLRQFAIECQSHSRTVWALYSAATFFASQTSGEFGVRTTDKNHTEATLMNRERTINSWTNTDEFMKLAA